MLSKEWQPALGLLWDKQSQASGQPAIQSKELSFPRRQRRLYSSCSTHTATEAMEVYICQHGSRLYRPRFCSTSHPPISAMQWSLSMSLRPYFLHCKKMCKIPIPINQKNRKIINTKQLVQSWNIINFECMI